MTVSYTPTSWVDGSTGLSAARLNNIESAIGTMAGSINRSATFTVAANNSSTADKNVADYLCDGTGDEVEINNAIMAANGAAGGIVQLCAGTYNISPTGIQMKSYVMLRGVGNGNGNPGGSRINISNNVASTTSAIINNTGFPIYCIDISDLYINCNKANNTQTTNGVYLSNAIYSTIFNVLVENAKNGIGIYTASNVDNVNITNCMVRGCDQDNIQVNGTRCRVVGCYSTGAGSGYSGISLTATASYNVVLGNNSTANSRGIYCNGTNNTITGNVVDGSTLYPGIQISGQYNEVTSNVCTTNYAAGFWFTGSNNTMTGNTATGNTGYGIFMGGTALNIIGNTVTNNGFDGMYIQDATDCSIISNNIQGNGTYSNLSYSNITLIKSSTGSNYNSIQANVIRKGVNPNLPAYGISIASGCNYNMYTNNDMHTAGQTGNISDSGTGSVTSAGNRTT